MVHGRGRFRVNGDAEPQNGDIAQPEGQAGNEADLGDINRPEPPGRIDAIAHRTAGKDGEAHIVPHRIGAEPGHGGDAIGHVLLVDGAQGEPVIQGQGGIGAGHHEKGDGHMHRVLRRERLGHIRPGEILKHVIEHPARKADDDEGENETEAMKANPIAQERPDL